MLSLHDILGLPLHVYLCMYLFIYLKRGIIEHSAKAIGSYRHRNTHSIDRKLPLQLHPFNGLFSRTTWISWYQKGKASLDCVPFDYNYSHTNHSAHLIQIYWSKRQWHQLGHMQICTLTQTHNHASIPPLSFFYRLNAFPAAEPTASKH